MIITNLEKIQWMVSEKLPKKEDGYLRLCYTVIEHKGRYFLALYTRTNLHPVNHVTKLQINGLPMIKNANCYTIYKLSDKQNRTLQVGKVRNTLLQAAAILSWEFGIQVEVAMVPFQTPGCSDSQYYITTDKVVTFTINASALHEEEDGVSTHIAEHGTVKYIESSKYRFTTYQNIISFLDKYLTNVQEEEEEEAA